MLAIYTHNNTVFALTLTGNYNFKSSEYAEDYFNLHNLPDSIQDIILIGEDGSIIRHCDGKECLLDTMEEYYADMREDWEEGDDGEATVDLFPNIPEDPWAI